MTWASQRTDVRTVFRLGIDDDFAMVRPPTLREQVGLDAGDVVAISVFGGGGSVSKAPQAKPSEAVTTEPVPVAMGLL